VFGRRSKLLTGALCLGLLSAGAALLSAQGCLVTDKVEFGELNAPPQVRIVSPRGAIVNAPTINDASCGNNRNRRYMKFQVAISDINVEDDVRLRIVVQGEELSGVVGIGLQPVTGKAQRATVDLCIDQNDLFPAGKPCSYVEFLVSRDWDEFNPPYATTFANDRGADHIIVGANSEDEPQSPKSDCYTDVGAP